MYTDWLAGVLVRDLTALKRQLDAYPDDASIWKTVPPITNTAGNLALHLAGNLQHFVGGQLGGSGYVRNREAEFTSRDLPRAELVKQVDAAIAAVRKTLPTLTDAQLDETFPQKLGDATVTTGDFLMHLAVHLTYHLGQIDYHRRILTGGPAAAGMVMPGELSSARKAPAPV